MQRLSAWLPIILLMFGLGACASSDDGQTGSAAVIRLPADPPQATATSGAQPLAARESTAFPIDPPTDCAVTQPPAEPFIPPPYAPEAPYPDEFWYGTDALWTMLRADGTWRALPYDNHGYSQKVFWWKRGYDWQAEPTPALTVSGRRLDGIAPLIVASQATNGYHQQLNSFILVGVDIPTTGCWEITGRIDGHSLSFVVRVAP